MDVVPEVGNILWSDGHVDRNPLRTGVWCLTECVLGRVVPLVLSGGRCGEELIELCFDVLHAGL